MPIKFLLAAVLGLAGATIAGCSSGEGVAQTTGTTREPASGRNEGAPPPAARDRPGPLAGLPDVSLQRDPFAPSGTSPPPKAISDPTTDPGPEEIPDKVLDGRYIAGDFFCVVVVNVQSILRSDLYQLASGTLAEIDSEAEIHSFLASRGKALGLGFPSLRNTLDQMALCMMYARTDPSAPVAFATIHRFSRPYPRDELMAMLRKEDGRQVECAGQKYWRFGEAGGLHFADETTLLFGQAGAIEAMLRDRGQPNELRAALRRFDVSPDVACLILADKLRSVLAHFVAYGGPPAQANLRPILELLQPAATVELALDCSGERLLRHTIRFQDADGAESGAMRLRQMWAVACEMLDTERIRGWLTATLPPLVIEDFVAVVEDLKDGFKIETDGRATVLSVRAPADFVGRLAKITPAIVTRSRESAAKSRSASHLAQIGVALKTYAAAKGHLPPAVVRDKEGKALYSWRVEILPFLGHLELYQAFNKDEPWDSPKNKELLEKMPDVFACGPNGGQGKSGVLAFVGKQTAWGDDRGMPLSDVTDGAATTLLVAAVPEDKAVEWTRPADLELPEEFTPAELVPMGQRAFLALFADGAVREIGREISLEKFEALLTPAGGEKVELPGPQ
jgi:hypothetical protein